MQKKLNEKDSQNMWRRLKWFSDKNQKEVELFSWWQWSEMFSGCFKDEQKEKSFRWFSQVNCVSWTVPEVVKSSSAKSFIQWLANPLVLDCFCLSWEKNCDQWVIKFQDREKSLQKFFKCSRSFNLTACRANPLANLNTN